MKNKIKKWFDKNKDKIFVWICVCLIAIIVLLVVLFQRSDIEKMKDKNKADVSVVLDDNNLYYNGSAEIFDDLNFVNYNTLNSNLLYAMGCDSFNLNYNDYDSLILAYFTCRVDFIIDNLNAYYPNSNYPSLCYISVPSLFYSAFDPLDFSFGYFVNYTYSFADLNSNMLDSSYLLTYFNNWDIEESSFLDSSIPFDYQYSLQSPVGDYQNYTFYFPFNTLSVLNSSSDYLVFYVLSSIGYDGGFLYENSMGDYSLYNLVFNSPSSLQDDYNNLVNQYNSYVNTHSYTNVQYNDYVNSHSYTNTQYNDLQSQYNNYVSTHSYTDTQYNDYVNSHSYTNEQYNNSYNDGYNVGYNDGVNSALLNENNNNLLLNSVLIAKGYQNNTLLHTSNQFDSIYNDVYKLTFLTSNIGYEPLNDSDYLTSIVFEFSQTITINSSYFIYVTDLPSPNYHLTLLLDDTVVADLNYQNDSLPLPITFNNEYTFNKIKFYNTYSQENQVWNVAFGTSQAPYNYYLGSGSQVSGYASGYQIGFNDGLKEGHDNGYQEGLENSYSLGYQAGYNVGIQQDVTNSGFRNLFNSILSYPINFISSVFNFEFMGINVASVVLFLVSIGVVLFVIKRLWK